MTGSHLADLCMLFHSLSLFTLLFYIPFSPPLQNSLKNTNVLITFNVSQRVQQSTIHIIVLTVFVSVVYYYLSTLTYVAHVNGPLLAHVAFQYL